MNNQHTPQEFLLKISDLAIDEALTTLKTSRDGLSDDEASLRLKHFGKNQVAREKPLSWFYLLLANFTNPFIIVLIVLGTVSYLTGDLRATVIVLIMVLLSVVMRFIQEFRSSKAAEALRTMVLTKATVRRSNKDSSQYHLKIKKQKIELPFEELVPGDIIYLSAGDMIPADLCLLRSKDLFISQAALTGESMPVEKYGSLSSDVDKPHENIIKPLSPIERSNLCFLGTNVISGVAKAVVVATGERTYFGSLAKNILGHRSLTSFDKGVNKVTWILIKFILIMVPIVFLINIVLKGNWEASFLFALAVAVGLTPEMLPMIVTANLAKGAVAMSKHKVIVKRLNSIQNLGAMDILCTDKTGTLTQDKIILEKYLDIHGNTNLEVLEYGFLNSYYQTGLKNLMDRAVLDHFDMECQLNHCDSYKKIDEVPFDFVRRRMSVVVSEDAGPAILICKGAVEELLSVCSRVKDFDKISPLNCKAQEDVITLATQLNTEGFRVIAVAYKEVSGTNSIYSLNDEHSLILVGLMAFLDPPKETAVAAIGRLKTHGVQVKILTGDNEIVTKRICMEVNLPVNKILLGTAIESMSDKDLMQQVEETTIFAKLTPFQKARIIRLLQDKGHTVGFLGDGINDAVALRESDVGISVDSAADIAKESADIILLEKSLLVLEEGVLKGREVYGNIIKYIKMTASSNFGNVLSVLIASALLPFLPMLPLQLLIQNLLYDTSQLVLPWDKMDKDFLDEPRKWEPNGIVRFMLFVGPISSIFDMATFAIMWFGFHANSVAHQSLFQSGWFVEGLLSQTLIVHMIRTKKIPFIQSIASTKLLIMTGFIAIVGLYLPFSELAPSLHFVGLPSSYFIFLLITLLSYCSLVQLVKVWYIKKFKSWL